MDFTSIKINPNIPEADSLRHFINNFVGKPKTLQGSSTESQLSREVVADLKTVLDSFDQYDNKTMPLYKVKGYISSFKNDERNYYAGCSECKKKVTEDTYGYICPSEICGKKMEKPTYYYSFSMRIKDQTCEFWVDFFGNLGEKILKMNCNEYRELLIEGDQDKLSNFTNQIESQQLFFIIKPKLQTFNNQQKKRLSAYRLEQVDKSVESRKLADEILSILDKI